MPADGCYSSYGVCINTPTENNGVYYCKTTQDQVWWYPVLCSKYGCTGCSPYYGKKRQTTQVMPAGPANLPTIDPNDPAAPYFSNNCGADSSPSQTGLPAGAWVAIASAVLLAGVIVVLGMVLYYSYNNNHYHRIDRL